MIIINTMYNVLVLLKYIYILIIFLTVITKFDSFDIVAHIDFFFKIRYPYFSYNYRMCSAAAGAILFI